MCEKSVNTTAISDQKNETSNKLYGVEGESRNEDQLRPNDDNNNVSPVLLGNVVNLKSRKGPRVLQPIPREKIYVKSKDSPFVSHQRLQPPGPSKTVTVPSKICIKTIISSKRSKVPWREPNRDKLANTMGDQFQHLLKPHAAPKPSSDEMVDLTLNNETILVKAGVTPEQLDVMESIGINPAQFPNLTISTEH